MNKKKLLALLMSLVITLTLMPMTVFATEECATHTYGEDGICTVCGLPDLPEASVQQISGKTGIDLIALDTDEELTGNLANLRSTIVGKVDVGTIYSFSTVENNRVDEFGDWNCDYRVTFDQPIKKNSAGLYGSYSNDKWGDFYDIAFLSPMDIPANTEIYLLSAFGLDGNFTYSEVVNLVGTFDCGVFNVGDCNNGTNMTVELVLKAPGEEEWRTVKKVEYTFGSATPITAGSAKFVYDDVNGNYNIVNSKFVSAQNATFKTSTTTAVAVAPVIENNTATATVTVDETPKTVEVKVDNTTITHTEATLTQTNVEVLVSSLLGTELPEEHNTLDIIVVKTDVGEEQTGSQTEIVKTVSYDAEPFAIVNKASDPAAEQNMVPLTNDDLNDQVTFTFRLPVPASMGVESGATVAVVHKSDDPDRYPTENYTATVQAPDQYSDSLQFVQITTTHFSTYTLTDITRVEGMKVVNLDTGKQYETLQTAISEVGSGHTLALLDNITDAVGMAVAEGSNFIVDFNGKTYTVNKPGAGSSNTETNAFQLLKNSTIVFKNGTINISADNLTEAEAPAKNIKRVFQNYANLTLDNMVIDATNQYGDKNYPLSFNNGSVVIKDTTIQGASDIIAFDVCSGWGDYLASSVEVKGTSDIKGSVEVANYDATNPDTSIALTLTSGTIEGNLVMGTGADETTVTKQDTFNQTAPEGYEWVSNNDSTATLMKKVQALGGSLRKRARSNGYGEIVFTETDLRFGFKIGNVSNFSTANSYFTYEIANSDKSGTVPASKIDSTTKMCNLVLTGVPSSEYKTKISVTLHVLNDSGDEVDTATLERSVQGVANELNAPAYGAWQEYAQGILGQIQ